MRMPLWVSRSWRRMMMTEAKQSSDNKISSSTTAEKDDDNNINNNNTRTPSPELPPDIIMEILSRVPAKCVAQSRCVSKLWLSITLQPFFVHLHHTRSLSRTHASSHLLSFLHPLHSRRVFSFLTDFAKDKAFQDLTLHNHGPHRLSEVINGIVCIHNLLYNSVQVCNLTTHQITRLPPDISMLEENDASFLYQHCFSFGYEPHRMEYKVLHLCTFTRDITPQRDKKPRTQSDVVCHIFTLTRRIGESCWRKTDVPHPYQLYNLMTESVCVNGTMYWRHKLGREEIMLALDLHNEKFRHISVPTEASEFHAIKQVRGRVALMGFISSYKLKIWMLQDDGHNWIKEYCIIYPPHVSRLCPIGAIGNGLVLFVRHGISTTSPCTIDYCDLETQHTKNFCSIEEVVTNNIPLRKVSYTNLDIIVANCVENCLTLTY